MAAFIIISADNRLHYLVDGIEKCRPLNPSVVTDISTGKIIKSADGSYTYEYKIHGESSKGQELRSLHELLSNQLAAFRLAHSIPKDQLVNIFFLENPLSESDYKEAESWIQEFDTVFDNGKGSDTAFCLYRIIFSYCHEKPTDICSQIDCHVLKRIIEQHKITRTDSEKFANYIFYVDNQKSDAAATCLTKDDHDLKMPRYLLDFMMLVSNPQDSYSILNAINGPTNNVKCFSVGYGESMYFFPDVKEYYSHADKRDLYNKYLTDDDETGLDISKKAMDIEKHPFGLKKRLSRLEAIYGDIPFDEIINISLNPADWIIDQGISALKDLIFKERNQEKLDFLSSDVIVKRKNRISQLETQICEIIKGYDETEEEFQNRLSTLKNEKEVEERNLQTMIDEFEPVCPSYTDRNSIYMDLSVVTDDEKRDETYKRLEQHYNKLLGFVLSNKFRGFIDEIKKTETSSQRNSVDDSMTSNTSETKAKKPCCLKWLMFWKKSHREITDNVTATIINPQNAITSTIAGNAVELLTSISEQIKLKSEFKRFKENVGRVKRTFEAEKAFCKNFKLKSHTNHFYHLINLSKLKEQQSKDFLSRIESIISNWRRQDNPTKSSLDLLNDNESIKHSKQYEYIDWENMFSFVSEITLQNLPIICNELQKKASPFVNYNLTRALKEDKIVRALFSDRPTIKNEFEKIKSQLDNGIQISPFISTHIASKICFMEFLPMDDEVIDNLVDLQDSNNFGSEFDQILSNAEQINKETPTNNETINNDPPVEFWGEHGG